MGKPEFAQKLYQDDPRPCFLLDQNYLLLWGNPAFFAMFPFVQPEQPTTDLFHRFGIENLYALIERSRFLQQSDEDGNCLQITMFYNRKKPFYLAVLSQSAPVQTVEKEKNSVLLIDYYINTLTHPMLQKVLQARSLIEAEPSAEQLGTLFDEMERQCRMMTRLSYLTETYYRSGENNIPGMPRSFRTYFTTLMEQVQALFVESGCAFSYSSEYAACGLILDVRQFEVAFLGLLSVCYEYEKGRNSKLYCRAIYDKEQLHIFLEDDITNADEIMAAPEKTVLSQLAQTDDLVLLYQIVTATLRQVIEQHGGSCEIGGNGSGIQVHIVLPAWPDQALTVSSSDMPSLIPIMLSNIK